MQTFVFQQCRQHVEVCMSNSMSRGDLNASRWLDAFSERCVGLQVTPGAATFVDVAGDGNRCLVAADTNYNSIRGKMRVYRGTAALDISLPDVPSSLVAFYTDQLEPRIPAVAVACGPNLYIYKNNKPFFKCGMPCLPISSEEVDYWREFFDGNNNVQKLVQGLSSIPYNLLSIRSQELLSTTKIDAEELLEKYDPNYFFEKQLKKESPITCMTTLKKTSNDRDEVSCPVIATESGNVFILDPQSFAVVHQANTYRTKVAPCVIRALGIFNVEYRIVIATRERHICLLRKGWLEGKSVVQLIETIVDFILIPDDNFIVVATVDKMINCFTKRGNKLWSLEMANQITCLNLVYLEHINITLIAVGLRNGSVQLYNGRKLADQSSVPGIPSVVVFGQLGQEEHVLVIITIDGTVLFRILKRTAEFQLNTVENQPPPQSKALPLPKRSKLFLEHSLREKNSALEMHQTFQQDLICLRLDTAKELLKYNSTQTDMMSQKEQIKLSAQVLGLGPKFQVIFTLDNMESEKSMKGICMILHVDSSIYSCSTNRIMVPLLQPGFSYKMKVNVKEVIKEQERDMSNPTSWSTIRVFVMRVKEEQLVLAAVINMPPTEYIY